jgi:hypothetical protein
MAFTVGVNTDAYVNGIDLTPYLAGSDAGAAVDAVEITPYGATNNRKQYIPGLQQTTINVTGYFDPQTGGNELTLRSVLGTAATWTLLPSGDAAGARGQAVAGFETDLRHSAPVAGAVTITATSQGTVPAEGVVVLATKQTLSQASAGTSTVTGVDFGTALLGTGGTVSTGALSSYIHVFSGSGSGTVTVNVQHASTLGGTYSTLLSHTAFVASTAPTYERKLLVAGTSTNEFLRTQVVFSGAGTVSLHNSVCRYT